MQRLLPNGARVPRHLDGVVCVRQQPLHPPGIQHLLRAHSFIVSAIENIRLVSVMHAYAPQIVTNYYDNS